MLQILIKRRKMTTELPVDLSAKTRNVSVQTEHPSCVFKSEHTGEQLSSSPVINGDYYSTKPVHRIHREPNIKPVSGKPSGNKPSCHRINLNNLFSAKFDKIRGRLADLSETNLSEQVEGFKDYILEITFDLLLRKTSLETFNTNINQLVSLFNRSKV